MVWYGHEIVNTYEHTTTPPVTRPPCYRSSKSGSIAGMKVSVSLPEEDIEFLDSYAHAHGIESRSAAVHKAVGLLRAAQLGNAYEEAWASWSSSDDAAAWDNAVADGLDN
jgi:Arc/MetJ-type ribon-helix-helix transcriptional regulator